MRQELKVMYDLLLEQKSVQEELLRLAHDKQQSIIKGDTEALTEIVMKEQYGVTRLNNIDKRRTKLLPDISALIGVPAGDITLTTIINNAAGDERNAFFVLQKELGSLITAQQDINDENRKLLKTQIEYAESMLSVVVGEEDPLNNFYGGDGRSSPERKKTTGFFDRQI